MERLGARERLPVRLVAYRLPEEQAQARLRHQEEHQSSPPKGVQRPNARKAGRSHPHRQIRSSRPSHLRAAHRSSRKRRELLGWTLLLTNVPREKLSKEEVLVLARCRGPIELLWKWGKQLVKVDTQEP